MAAAPHPPADLCTKADALGFMARWCPNSCTASPSRPAADGATAPGRHLASLRSPPDATRNKGGTERAGDGRRLAPLRSGAPGRELGALHRPLRLARLRRARRARLGRSRVVLANAGGLAAIPLPPP